MVDKENVAFFDWRQFLAPRFLVPTIVLLFRNFLSFFRHSNFGFSVTCLFVGFIFFVRWKISKEEKSQNFETREDERGHNNIYTRIHGQWYDLSGFSHPGGPVALSLAKGRDATAMFESHHYFISRKKMMQILKKWKVPSKEAATLRTMDERDDGSPYEWNGIEKDAFTSELRSFVMEHFTTLAKERGISITDATKATPQRLLLVCFFFGLFYASIPFFVRGLWIFILVTPVLAWLTVVNYWHDALHFALTSDWRINAVLPYFLPLLSSPSMWYHHHVVGHHAYTNIGHKDPDLAHAPQLMREHDSIRWRPSHSNQARLPRLLLIWSVAVGLGLHLLNDLRAVMKLTYNNVVPCETPTKLRIVIHLVGRFLYVFFTFLWPFMVFPIWKAMIWATVPNTILSICFMLNTQINHLVEPCAHEADSNFFKHQVVTAQNFGNGSLFCYYFSGGLNYQIEHHLFPTVNHCHLPSLSHGVKKICEKHGVPYHCVSGYKEAVSEHFKHTATMAKKPH